MLEEMPVLMRANAALLLRSEGTSHVSCWTCRFGSYRVFLSYSRGALPLQKRQLSEGQYLKFARDYDIFPCLMVLRLH